MPHVHRVLHHDLGPARFVCHLVASQHALSELLVCMPDLLEHANRAVLAQDCHEQIFQVSGIVGDRSAVISSSEFAWRFKDWIVSGVWGGLGLGLGRVGTSSSRNCSRTISGAKGSNPVFRNALIMVFFFFESLYSDRMKCMQEFDFVEIGAARPCRLLNCLSMVVLKRLEHNNVERL